MAVSAQQMANAKVIIQVGRQLGASDRDITIALMAGWQESGLRNLNYGDRDSIGIFQQRNAWGSRSDRLDPVKSARMFFLGGQQGQRGLLDFSNRDSYSLGQAAQKVQVSAFPDAYDKWQDDSEQLMRELGGSAGAGKPTTPGGTTGTGTTGTDPSKGISDALMPQDSSTPLGIGSPVSTEAIGVDAGIAPGLESADKAPVMPSYSDSDLMSMFDQGKPATPDFKAPADGNVFGGNESVKGNYSLPGVKPYVLSAANELGGRFGIKSIGGVGNRPNESDHPGGKALDFMTRSGGSLAAFAEANFKRLNIKYIIWNQHIWNPSRAGEGWRLMEDRGGDTENHKDHVHISFN